MVDGAQAGEQHGGEQHGGEQHGGGQQAGEQQAGEQQAGERQPRRQGGGRQELGRWGEDLAAQHLVAGGAQVLARNWRCREGELDIVALEPGGTVVFCEVKTRSGTGFGEPAEAVGPVKARRLRLLACRWLAEHRPAGAGDLRFDVVAVVRARGSAPRVVHLRGAF